MTVRHTRSALDLLVDRLVERGRRSRWRDYRIPALWNVWGYAEARPVSKTEIAVDPHAFALECLNRVILPRRGRRRFAGRSLSRVAGVESVGGQTVLDGGRRRKGGDWIRTGSIYGMMVRTTSAWDHDGDGKLSSNRCTETGTFLKSILLLPLLQRMGITAIYLLPVAKHSNLYRKGELGCPYSVKDFFTLEPSLHDRLLGGAAPDVEIQFGAFVEAAHVLGMRVLLDLAPRTTSRDSDWILDHPDWFYWIDRRAERDYAQPHIDGADYLTPKASHLPAIHAQPNVREHLARFRFAPNVTAPGKWRRFVKQAKANPPPDLPARIGREFGVITPPGFSDVINDPQPPWSDVTFLRYYRDHPTAVQRCLRDPQRQPPYVFTEVIKSSRFPGRKPALDLWKTLAGILPFYQKFGVDGARIDMGHALPRELEEMILSAPRRTDPDFCFIAEELGIENSAKAKRAGYNMIIGPSWWMEPRIGEGRFHDLVHELLPASKLPIWAAAETPDTPRAVARHGGKRFVHLAATVNHFLPNAVPFVNSGMEVYERQPMNLGLDTSRKGRFELKKTDPYYGKLAFFDRYVLHWGNAGATGLVKMLEALAAVRSRFAGILAGASAAFTPQVVENRRFILAIGFHVAREKRTLLVVANTDFRKTRRAVLAGLPRASRRPPRRPGAAPPEVLIDVGGDGTVPTTARGRLSVTLPPGAAQVLLL